MTITIATDTIRSSTGTVNIDGNIAADNLSDVAFSGDYNDLINTPSANHGTVVDSWHSGVNWWREWSDGFIEQGGISTQSASADECKVTFHKSFSTSNLYVLITDNSGKYTGNGAPCWHQVWDVSRTSFTRKGYNSVNLAAKVGWTAFGY